jgi:SanA protein
VRARTFRTPLLVVVSFACGLWIGEALAIPIWAAPSLYDDPALIPKRHVGVLLGCSARQSNGSPNPYFVARVDAAVRLYDAGKIDYILVSGENSQPAYNEPAMLRAALVRRGVPSDRIVADYAGFRTLDSVVRAHEVFGLDSFTVISQRFHNERAVYLADGFGSSALGFNAAAVGGFRGFKACLREALSRASAALEVRVLRTRPRYLGPRVEIDPLR